MENMTIGEVAQRAGIRTSTIRYYESINLLPQPKREHGHRRYEPAVLDRLAFIQVTQQLGFTLTEIQQLFQQQAPLTDVWQALAKQKLTEVERLIQQAWDVRDMLLQGLHCGCTNLTECMACVCEQCQSGM